MISNAATVLMGAVAMASSVACVFFLRFWRDTRDTFFLLFSLAFGIDAVARLVLGLHGPTGEMEPLYYVARLVTFLLILAAIVLKNRRKPPG